jgi:hypothetical protein
VSRFGRLINAGFGRCKHRVLGTCVDAADGCCAGVACAICVKLLDADGEVVDGVSLAWDGTGYSGSVGGFSFESYWLDNYGDCEFHVIISAGGYIEPIHIIKTKGDYTDAACCMNPGGETEVDDGTDTYTMTWSPVDPLILARRLVSEGCYERFCGDCDCAPRKLCLQVSSDDCNVAKIISLAENYADPDCPLPVWDLDFTCGTFSFSGQVALVRDEYTGGCILQMSGTRGGAEEEESHDFAITDCAALSASFTLTEDYVDYLITVSPADCDACRLEVSAICCPDKIPVTLYLTGGLIPIGQTVVLGCSNCPPETADNYIERTFMGQWDTDWLVNYIYGSGGEIITKHRCRLRVYAIYTCGSGFNLGLAADVLENDPDPQFTPIAIGLQQSSSVQNVSESCDPILNLYDALCVRISPGIPINYSCPQTYVVSE